MTKIHTTLSIDQEVLRKAKELQLNISAEVEKFLRNKSGEQVINPNEAKCDFCGMEEEQETLLTEGMTWLCPDEVWICSRCLNDKKRRIAIKGN